MIRAGSLTIPLTNETNPNSNGGSVAEISGMLGTAENVSFFNGPKMGHWSAKAITPDRKLQRV